MFIEPVMPSSRLILLTLFSSCPRSFPVSGTFPMSRLLASDDQSTVLAVLLIIIVKMFYMG